jgi:hypothetical protein
MILFNFMAFLASISFIFGFLTCAVCYVVIMSKNYQTIEECEAELPRNEFCIMRAVKKEDVIDDK